MAVILGLLPTAGSAAEVGTISGRVSDARGLPLQDVCVTLNWLFRPYLPSQLVRTDVLGRYTLSDVPAGAHYLSFNLCDDPVPGQAAEWWNDVPGLLEAEPVVIFGGEAKTGHDASLAPAGSLRGIVTDEAGQPLAGQCATVIGLETFAIGETRTAEDGTYLMPALAPGDYIVAFSDCTDPFVHMAEYYDDLALQDLREGAEPVQITVVEGEEVTADAALATGGAITGSITAAHTGEPIQQACAMLIDPATEESYGEYGGATGVGPDRNPLAPEQYVAGAVLPGDYLVRFLGQGCVETGYAERWYGGTRRAAAERVIIPEGVVVEGIDAVLRPVPSIDYACGIQESSFQDVAYTNPHAEAIACLNGAGIVTGRSSTRFAPAADVRRDQMASMLARLLEATGTTLPEEPADHFTDDNGNVHERAINQMAELGVVTGIGGDEYGPHISVTRGQMASLLAGSYEFTTGYTLRTTRDWFTDDDLNLHHGRINHMATAGVATGTGGGRFSPNLHVRRDQMASFLARAFDRISRDTAHLRFGFSGGGGSASGSSEGGGSTSEGGELAQLLLGQQTGDEGAVSQDRRDAANAVAAMLTRGAADPGDEAGLSQGVLDRFGLQAGLAGE